MADFLNDEIDVERAASAFPDINFNDVSDIPISDISTLTTTSIPLSTQPVKLTADDDVEKFENMFPDIDGGSAPSAPPLAVRFFSLFLQCLG
jgi:hypothetical protein